MRAVADTGEEGVVEAILSISAAAVPQRRLNEALTDASLAAKNWQRFSKAKLLAPQRSALFKDETDSEQHFLKPISEERKAWQRGIKNYLDELTTSPP
jgi:hypothetical protein